MAYYHDHRETLDAVIARQLADVDRIAGAQTHSLLREQLKRAGRQ